MSDLDNLRRAYAAFNEGDPRVALALLAPDADWQEAENFLYADRTYTGPEEVAEALFTRIARDFYHFKVMPAAFHVSPDSITVEGRYQGVFASTGRRVDAQFAHIWTFRDGRVVRMRQYTDTAQFRDAAGMSAVAASI